MEGNANSKPWKFGEECSPFSISIVYQQLSVAAAVLELVKVHFIDG